MIGRLPATVVAAAAMALCAFGQPLGAQTDSAKESKIRGRAYEARQSGSWSEAADAFLELHGLRPAEPKWVVEAADALGRAGRVEEALTIVTGARERFPGVLDLPVSLAKTLHLLAERDRGLGYSGTVIRSYYKDAAEAAQTVVDADPEHLEGRLLFAQSRFQLGELEQAIEQAKIATAKHPEAAGAWLILGQSWYYTFRGRQNELSRTRGRSEIDRVTASVKEAEDAARSALTKAAEVDPDRSIAWLRLGDLAGWSGRTDDAADAYERALGVDPRSVGQVDTDWLRGTVGAQRVAEMWIAARKAYAARRSPDPVSLALLDYYGGLAHYQAEDLGEARAWFERCLVNAAGRDEFDDAWYWIMRTAYWDGDKTAARKAALAYTRKSPKALADAVRRDDQTAAIPILQYLADTAFAKRELADSRDLNYVLALLHQSASAWNNYAFLCRETGRFDDAWKGYSNALLEERSPQILNDGAVILQYHLANPSNLAKAREMYEEAIKLGTDQLRGGGLDAEEEQRTRTAVRDARSNLAKLGS